jgi:hypothetical protein
VDKCRFVSYGKPKYVGFLNLIVLEKVEWLIDKLKRQFDTDAGPAAMLSTLQLLQQQLSTALNIEQAQSNTQKISVVMPVPRWNTHAEDELDVYEAEAIRGKDEQKVVFELDPYVEEVEPKEEPLKGAVVPPPAIPTAQPPEKHEPYLPTQKQEPPSPQPIVVSQPAAVVPPSIQAVEMPNPAVETNAKSLNELHEKPLSEVIFRFQEPIKDLKKAISINDRYQYISSLFRNDEAAYDRSIKTINGFHVYSEAEYWMRRELATKYGWKEDDLLVQQFYHLVSRRFA